MNTCFADDFPRWSWVPACAGTTQELRLLALAELRQRADLALVAVEIRRQTRVELGVAFVHLARRRILADEIGDLLHLGDETVGLGKHRRHLPGQPAQQRRLALAQLVMQ